MPHTQRTLCLFLSVLLGGYGLATKVLPGSPLAPTTPRLRPEATTIPAYSAKLELLLDVRALYEMGRASGPVPKLQVAQASGLRTALQALLNAPELDSPRAETLQQALRQALGEAGRASLLATRAQMEKRASMALASSRVARDEGLPTVAELRLAFMVPGGQATVRALGASALWNPFRQGVPAVTVRGVLTALGR